MTIVKRSLINQTMISNRQREDSVQDSNQAKDFLSAYKTAIKNKQ